MHHDVERNHDLVRGHGKQAGDRHQSFSSRTCAQNNQPIAMIRLLVETKLLLHVEFSTLLHWEVSSQPVNLWEDPFIFTELERV